MRIAYLKSCAGCGEEIFMALSRDGRWRPFETPRVGSAPNGVWAWRKGHGMEEQDQFPGYRMHYCADFHDRIDPVDMLSS